MEAPASPFAQTVAYGQEIDLTPRAFTVQEAPARSEVTAERAKAPARRPAWKKRATIAAVTFAAVAATVAVVQSGLLRTTAAAPAKPADASRSAPAAVPPQSPPAAVATTKPAATTTPAAPAPTTTAKPATPPAPAVTAAAAEAPAPAAATPAAPASSALPSYVSEPGVRFLTRVAVQRAERTCHRRGRAVGKALVYVTFAQNGRATEARVEGEPIESAPVARCIKDQLYAVVIPKFDGAPFTVSEPITLY